MINKIFKFSFIFALSIILIGCTSSGGGGNTSHVEHTFGQWETSREQTCIQEGEEIRYCECGMFETRYTGFSDHNYRLDYTQEPSCYEQGRKRYSCEHCGVSYEDFYGEPSHHHTLIEQIDPQCGTDGYKYYQCHGCGDSYQETLPAPECSFIEGERVEPTCVNEGYVTYVCTTNPSHTYQETIAPNGEHSIKYNYSKDWHDEYCENCFEYYMGGMPHNFQEEVLGEGTCLNGAEIIKKCVCGYQYTDGFLFEHQYENEVCSLCSEHKPSEGLQFTYLDGNYILSGLGTCDDLDIYIPSRYLGKDVIGIADYAFTNGTFNNVTIPNSIIYFGSYAFANCINLQNVYYNGSLRNWMDIVIEETTSAFNTSSPMAYASNIYFKENNEYVHPTVITIPEDVTEIKPFTFSYFKQITEYIFHENVEKIGIGSFAGASGFNSINLVGVKIIDNAAFYNVTSLENITFSNDLKIINPSAFNSCSSLDNVIIPDGVEAIFDGAFNRCTNLKKISIPDSIKTLGHYVFDYCNNLEYYQEDNALYLGNENNKKLVLVSLVDDEILDYEVDSNTKILLNGAFYGSPNIKNLKIHENVIHIEYFTLRPLEKLISLELPLLSSDAYSTCRLSDYADNLENLEYLKITKCESLSSGSLSLASNVKELILPNDIRQIGYNALEGFSNLEALTIPYISYEYDDAPSDLDYLFNGLIPQKLKKLNLTNSIYIASTLFAQCHNFEELTVPDNLRRVQFTGYTDCDLPYTEYENGMYIGSSSNPYQLFVGLVDKTATSVTLHNDTKVIFNHSLRLCDFIEYTIYREVKYVGSEDNLFEYAVGRINDNLTDIYLHEDTKVVYENVISYQSSVTLPKGIKQVVIFDHYLKDIDSLYYSGSIYDWMEIDFYGYRENPMYYSKNFYYLDGSEYKLLEELVIPEDVTEIKDYQFVSSNIIKLDIHENVTSIGVGAFKNCINLQELNLHMKEGTINESAFEDCGNIQTLVLESGPKVFKSGVFNETNVFEIIYMGDVSDWLEITFDSITSTPVSDYSTVMFNDGENNILLESVEIKGNIEVGDYQFYNFRNLNSISVEYGVTEIGELSFANTNITNLSIPDSVEYIGYGAFSGCNLFEVNLPFLGESINDIDNANIYHLIGKKPDSTLSESLSINKAVIRGGYIGAYAFYRCVDLREVNIPNVSNIGDYAFSYCYYLEDIVLPNKLYSIGRYAFSDCNAITNITLPGSLRYVGEDAFNNDSFANIYFKDSIQKWFNISFESERSNPKYISENIYFYTNGNYEKLSEKLVVDSSITSIGAYQLVNFDEIKELYIHDDVEYIGEAFLTKCDNIEKITTPFLGAYIDQQSDYNSVHYFYNHFLDFFEEGDSITELVITKATKVGSVNGYGFNKLPNLKKLTLPGSLKYCSMNPYYINDLIEEVHFNGTLEEYCNVKYNNYREDTQIGNFVELYLLDNEGEEYLLTNLVIPESITTINHTLFAGMSLNDVYLHNGINEIAGLAFFNSHINNVYYNGNDETWFNIKIEYSKSNPALYANDFYFNYGGTYEVVTSATINDEIYTLAGQVAGFKHLESLVVGSSVERIENAFLGCESLQKIYFKKNLNGYLNMAFIGDVPVHELYLLDENNEYYLLTEVEVNTSMFSHFSSIKGLTKVTISEPFESNSIVLNENALSNNPDLEEIIIDGEIANIMLNVFKNNPKLRYKVYDNGNYLGNDDNPYKYFISVIDNTKTSLTVHNDTEVMVRGSLVGSEITDLSVPFIGHSGSYNELWQVNQYYTLDSTVVNLIVTNSKAFPQISKSPVLRTVTFELGLDSFSYPYDYLYITKFIVKGESTFEGLSKDDLMHLPYLEYTIYNNGKYLGTVDNPYQVLCGKVDESLDVIAHENCTKILE